MSKKMLKRSLALGALMAFVITGSAMAADSNKAGSVIDPKGATIEYESLDPIVNTHKDGYGVQGTGKLIVASELNITSGDNAIYGKNGTLTVDALRIVIDANGSPDDPANGLFVDSCDLAVNTNYLKIDSEGHGINSGAQAGNSIIINNSGNNSAVVNIIAGENAVYAHKIGVADASGNGNKIEINAKDVTLASTSFFNDDDATTKGFAINAASKNSAVVINATGKVDLDGKNGAIKATNNSTVNLTGDSIDIDVVADDKYDKDYIDAVRAGISNERTDNNGTVNLTATKNIDIDITGKWVNGIIARGQYGRGYGDPSQNGQGGIVNVNAEDLNITASGTGTGSGTGIWASNGTTQANGEKVATININATNTNIKASHFGISNQSQGIINIKNNLTVTAPVVLETRGNAVTNINTDGKGVVNLTGDILFDYATNSGTTIDADVNLVLVEGSKFEGKIYKDISAMTEEQKANQTLTTVDGMKLGMSDGATWTVTGDSFVNTLNGNGGIIELMEVTDNDATRLAKVDILTADNSKNLTVQQAGVTADDFTTKEAQEAQMEALASAVTVTSEDSAPVTAADTLLIAEGAVVGAVTASVDENGNVGKVVEATNTTNQAIGEAAVALKSHWRAHMNDMNKRMGELRNANGETGVWTRMVRGETEFEGAKAQYNQYQLGYDEKLSVDKRWTVGAAVTFAEGEGSFGKGTTEDDSTAFAIYGSKLNNDGTFVDLIARYARMESDVTSVTGKTADYCTNGYSVSAEFGKRIQQGNGLWIEPQVELTYGSVDSAEYVLDGKNVQVGDMDSLIGRVGFRLGKDIKEGNVYARASYLYDFDGETETAFSNAAGLTRTIEEDLGGDWWEVGVGANINLSKATYIYADVEKTFGGEVDTNWQWNLGVRYSF
ncbi:MAG: autotransporter outer membrane beta-barrel domain-containing protein [Phascolarctobacterium sp.]|nr:autotransporter outer membrane beta-barrel domain-containing protein [Phascolarctobacterium sp.]